VTPIHVGYNDKRLLETLLQISCDEYARLKRNILSPLSSVAKKQGLDDTIDYEVSKNMNITPNDSFQACDASITKALNAFLLGDSVGNYFLF